MRLGRYFASALFVLVMAVTPLSAITSGGIHEAWIGSEYGRGPVRVVLEDRTGLVRAITAVSFGRSYPQLSNASDPRVLFLNWGTDCPAYQLNLTFWASPGGYTLEAAENSLTCSFFDRSRAGTIAISLSHPVDAATVWFVSRRR